MADLNITADPSTLAETVTTTLADGVASATVDGQSVTAIPLAEQLAALKEIQGIKELQGQNSRGGKRSGFRACRPAKFIPPGSS